MGELLILLSLSFPSEDASVEESFIAFKARHIVLV
jgi:hypothetical protein